MEETREIELTANGVLYKVINPAPDLYLIDWLRDKAHLTGAKKVCGEGGCGTCVVAIAKEDPICHPESIYAVNSCLQPVISLDGCHVITAEGLGGKKNGLHPLQEKFVENFASQCGYCTPGFVMSSFSYIANSENEKSEEEIEKCLDGNICRCTGYRPIMDAVKSFSNKAGTVDIEDFHKLKFCKRNCIKPIAKVMNCRVENGAKGSWYNPSTLSDLLATIKSLRLEGKSWRIVAGNTVTGIFKEGHCRDAYIGIGNVKELKKMEVSDNEVEIGAGLALTDVINFMARNRQKSTSFAAIAEYLEKVASRPIRNVATWAGNLMLFNQDRNFPSDVFVIFSAVDAKLTIADSDGAVSSVTIEKFLNSDFSSKIIISAKIPCCKEDEIIRSYTVMPRKQSSYGYVNAGFYANFDVKTLIFKERPRLFFGGVGLKKCRADHVEDFLFGKSLDENVFQEAVRLLLNQLESNPTNKLVDFDYCKRVSVNLFYKFCLLLHGDRAQPRMLTALKSTAPLVSSGKQTFHQSEDENSSVHKPLFRIEGNAQASGESQFVGDIPVCDNEAFGVFVLSTVGKAKLESIDATEAKAHPGFIAFISAEDIPGVNSWRLPPIDFEIFATKDIEYFGQPLGLLLADSQQNARTISKLVKVEYSDIKKPVTSLKEAVELKQFHPTRFPPVVVGDPEAAFKTCDHVIEGEVASGSQYHFYLEPQTCLARRDDTGFKIYSTTQCSRLVQHYVSRALGVNASSIEVIVPRLGGAFGGKIEYPSSIATAAAVAANALNRPVRINLELNDSLKMIGKRAPFLTRYKVGFSKEGKLAACKVDMYIDNGVIAESYDGYIASAAMDNAYFCPNWNITTIDCKTNTPFNTFVRGPGHVQGMFATEVILDHVASFLRKEDPEDVKWLNFYKNGQKSSTGGIISDCLLESIWANIRQRCEYEARRREIAIFNKENRWKKRGIALMPLRYPVSYFVFNFTTMVSIYYADGTVAVSSGGVEMGQGMNTRICQVVANQLKIPMDMITIRQHSTVTNPNSFETGGSVSSEINCLAVYKCCEILKERMKPIREKMPDATWGDIVKECAKERVDLSSQYMFYDPSKFYDAYTTYGGACSEVEIDVLTGEQVILRTDLVFDCGESINPKLDIGQLEGSFVMSIGLWFMEKIVYDEETGEQLTAGTWNYKPPMAKDAPIDMRVHLEHEAVNPIGFVRSKAVGEPGCCLSSTCFFAAKRAIEAAREEFNQPSGYFRLDGPATPDKIQKLCQVSQGDLIFN